MKPSPEKLKQVALSGIVLADKVPFPIRTVKSSFIAPRVISTLVRAIEFVSVMLAGLMTAIRYPGLSGATPTELYLALIFTVALSFPVMLQMVGMYRLTSLLSPLRDIPKIIGSWMILFSIIAVGLVLAKVNDNYSRIWLATWFAAGALFIIALRMFTAAVLRKWNQNGQLNRRAVLVGGGEPAAKIIAALKSSHDIDIDLVGIFDDRDDIRAPLETAGLNKLGDINALIDFVRQTRIDMLIVTLPLTAEGRLLQILNRLWVLPVDIRLSAYDQKLRYRPRAYSYIGNLALLDVFDKPLGDWGPVLKSIEDKVIASLALIIFSPIMLAVALAVRWESKGPILFKQKRFGFNNELIEIYKFRSMFTEMSDFTAEKLVTKGDPRVTRVGRFIRRTSLDELPQFINVLKGDLSLVGPRPHPTRAKAAEQLYSDVVDGYFARHKVRPGITGWAQINGWRGETDTTEKLQRRVEHDLFYIENWSLTFDLYILARTQFALLNTEHAY
jgi:Undecaprenyl-phosphate glucose phosphotransferase